MKIYLDNIAFSGQRSGGVSVVWKNLIQALQKFKPNSFSCIEYPFALENICRKELSGYKVENRNPRISFYIERRLLSPTIKCEQPFIFHSSYYRVCNNKKAINVTTVHDFTYEYYRSGFGKFLHCRQKYNAIRKSDYVICITENTKRDLLKFLPDIDLKKIRVIYNGVSDVYRPLRDTVSNMGKFILFVGWRETYKNFRLVVESIRDLEYNLAIVGSPLSEEERNYLNEEIGENRYKSFVRISDEMLNELYNTAYCLAYPSEYEGFGIPVLEAQKAGCPVIAYNASSIPEIIGNTPLLLKSVSPFEFREKLELLESNIIREEIITKGFANAERFSWNKMGEEYIKLYDEIESNYRDE